MVIIIWYLIVCRCSCFVRVANLKLFFLIFKTISGSQYKQNRRINKQYFGLKNEIIDRNLKIYRTSIQTYTFNPLYKFIRNMECQEIDIGWIVTINISKLNSKKKKVVPIPKKHSNMAKI